MSKENSIEATEIFSILSNTINGANFDDLCDATHMIVHNAGYHKQSAGEWIDKPTGAYGRMQSWCSACGKHSGIGGIESNRHKPFCPNCGAKMKGGE